MIASDVIAWLVNALAELDELCQYSVEYGTALLMNLSLRTAGKAKCASRALDILPVLSQLMESDSLQVRCEYVYIYTHIYIICVYVCMYVCIYIYIYIYICMYVCMYI